jgi:glycosyltransferase involved in cell wall biosynthesis
MRILQIIDSLHPGGAERMAVNIANGLVNKVTLSALCCGREEGLLKEQLDPKVNYLFANRQGKFGISGVIRTLKFIKKNRITHIHAHSTSIYLGYMLKLLRPNIKLIWHDHYGNSEFLKHRPLRWIKIMSKKLEGIIVVNQLLLDWAHANRLSNNVHYLANFASLQKSKGEPQPIPGTEGKRVVCLANLRPQKNQVLLLDAWQEVNAVFPDWDLLLVGKCFGDAYENRVRQTIEKNQLNQCVHILGSRTDTSRILEQSSIGVLSSNSEGLPLALLEYGLSSLPVIVTDVGACQEVVGDCGIFIPVNNAKALSNALIQLMEDTQLQSKYGKSLGKKINEEYGEKRYLDKLVAVYQS